MEAVAGLVIAEQIISTSVEGGILAAYSLKLPTLPLKGSYSCINTGQVEAPDATS